LPDLITFFVPGKAAPGGSKRAYVNQHTGKANIVDDAKNNAGWKAQVAKFAADRVPALLSGPLDVTFTFTERRPKGHFGTGRNAEKLKATAPAYPTKKPDVLKLSRSTEDALSGVLWVDDCQTVNLTARKRYGARPGVWIEVREMEG
jgi:Holliday junction resolvase RusA-like endonuclease